MMTQVRSYPAPPVCEKEILRYAGCRQADEATLSLLRSCLEEAQSVLTYTVCWRQWNAAFSSRDLEKNLAGCEKILVFAATVGIGLDRLITKYSRISPAKGLMMQAIGAERIESLCDAFCEDMEKALGLYAGSRFSPGYGDLPLTVQKDIFAALACEKHLGLYLNDSLMMTPSKSVTAFLGLSRENRQKTGNKCAACSKTGCAFRGIL